MPVYSFCLQSVLVPFMHMGFCEFKIHVLLESSVAWRKEGQRLKAWVTGAVLVTCSLPPATSQLPEGGPHTVYHTNQGEDPLWQNLPTGEQPRCSRKWPQLQAVYTWRSHSLASSRRGGIGASSVSPACHLSEECGLTGGALTLRGCTFTPVHLLCVATGPVSTVI